MERQSKEDSLALWEFEKNNVIRIPFVPPPIHLVPLDVVENIGKVLTYGAQKYSDNSWQNLPDFWKRYKAALLRHLTAIDKGELIDPESGLPHIDHVLCNTVFLDWGFHHGKAISINTKDIEQDE